MSENSLEIVQVTVGPLQAHCYIVTNSATLQCVVIDPGSEPDRILPAIGNCRVQAILLTHGHRDHTGAVNDVRAATGAMVEIHPADTGLIDHIRIDGALEDGKTIMIGTQSLRVAHTPGHTAGMVSFLLDDGRAIVGDTVFAGGPGRTWAAEDFQTTLHTLRTILTWPDETICYPGHGEAFRLGDIRPQIEAFVARTHSADFFGDAEW